MPMSPSSVLAITRCAVPAQTSPSGTTSSTRSVTATPHVRPPRRSLALSHSRPLELPCLLLDVLDPAAHEERLLGHVVVLALTDGLERGDRLLQRDGHARLAGELLGDEHRMRQKALDPPSPLHGDPVFLGQLVDAEDGDNILQLLVTLQVAATRRWGELASALSP